MRAPSPSFGCARCASRHECDYPRVSSSTPRKRARNRNRLVSGASARCTPWSCWAWLLREGREEHTSPMHDRHDLPERSTLSFPPRAALEEEVVEEECRPRASCAWQAGARRRAYAASRGNGRRSSSPMRRRPQACVRCLPAVIAAVLAAIAAVVTAIRSPVMTVFDDGRGTNDGRSSRDRSTTEYSRPASTSWA